MPLDAKAAGLQVLLMKNAALLILVLGVLLLLVLANVFTGFDASAMSLNGWIALGLGTFLSLALGIGLMALVFYSARRGYDDRIERDVPDDEK